MDHLNPTSWSSFPSTSVLDVSDWLKEQTLSFPVLASSENAADGAGEASPIFLLSSGLSTSGG